MPEHGEGDVFAPHLQFLVNQLQQLNLGKREFQYILCTGCFIQQISLHGHKYFITQLKVNIKIAKPCDQIILRLNFCLLTNKGVH